ncbi:hypothetical protein HSX11_06165 [Oxalobacteraceae bacterium]|nr:hypothetical protein [Oxalobacteraceae bacterium]
MAGEIFFKAETRMNRGFAGGWGIIFNFFQIIFKKPSSSPKRCRYQFQEARKSVFGTAN